MVDVEWLERQRVFQARILADPDPELDHMWFRTTVGPPTPAPPRPLGRLTRASLMIVGGAAVIGLLVLLDLPRVIVATLTALWGGAILIALLAGPEPRRRDEHDVALLALWPPTAAPGDPPTCVAPILADDRRRLGVDGAVTVIGRARPDATFGAFVDDHLVWPQARPRRARPEDPVLGE